MVKDLGASNKGKKRHTSMRSRRSRIFPVLFTAFKSPRTYSDNVAKNTSILATEQIPAPSLIQYLLSILPQFAHLMYLAYLSYKISEFSIQKEKEYRNLEKRLEEYDTLIVLAKFLLRDGIRYITDEQTSKKIRDEINDEIATLVNAKDFHVAISKIIGNEQSKYERFQSLLIATMSQFLVGIMTGTSDVLIKEAGKKSTEVNAGYTKYQILFNQTIPISFPISAFKIQLADELSEYVLNIAKVGVKLSKEDRDDTRVVIDDAVSSCQPSLFRIPLDFQPTSVDSVQKLLVSFTVDDVKKILEKVIGEIRRRQTRIGDFFDVN